MFFFSSRRRHTRYWRDWSSDVCSSDLLGLGFIVLTRALLQLRKRRLPVGFAEMGALDARKALLIVGVMTLHSFTEGVGIGRSEERRVGKECRSRWSPFH